MKPAPRTPGSGSFSQITMTDIAHKHLLFGDLWRYVM